MDYIGIPVNKLIFLYEKGDKNALREMERRLDEGTSEDDCIALSSYFWDLIARKKQSLPEFAEFSDYCMSNPKIFDYSQNGAKKGNVSCLYGVGCVYLNGFYGVEQDAQTAYQIFSLGENSNHAQLLGVLGLMYKEGLGVGKDENKAITALEKAISLGEYSVYAELGKIYQYGEQIPHDIPKAIDYYMKGYDYDRTGECSLAIAFGLEAMLDGETDEETIRETESEIRRFTEKAKQLGNTDADLAIGLYHEYGMYGYPEDTDKAMQIYQTCLKNGNEKAQNFIDNLKEHLSSKVIEKKPVEKVNRNDVTVWEKAYAEKKKKRLTAAAYCFTVLAVILRIIAHFVTLEPVRQSVAQYCYSNALILLSIMQIRNGKKGFVAGIFAGVIALIFDWFVLDYTTYSAKMLVGPISLMLPLQLLSLGVSILLYFILMRKIKTQTVGWYLVCVFWSIALAAIALLAAGCVLGVIVYFVTGAAASGNSYSGDYSTDSDSTEESYSAQAKEIAYAPGKYALYEENGKWYVQDYYGDRKEVFEQPNGDLYSSTYKTASYSDTSYVVSRGSLSDDSIYEAKKIDN